MLSRVLVRGSAIGALCGSLAAVAALRSTPEVLASPDAAFRVGGLIATVYVALAVAAALALWIVGRLVARLGAPGDRLTSGPVLWGLALGIAGLGVINEAAHGHGWIESFRVPLRLALGACALLLGVRGLARSARRRRLGTLVEGGLAALAGVAVVGGAAYFAAGPTGRGEPGEATAVSVAPRFEAEPAEVLAPVPAPRPRVLLLGIDGASWDRIDAGIRAGSLPTFARLVERGVRGPLRTLRPTYSPAIWTTIVTGVSPPAHGIDDFYLFQLPRLGLERLRLPRAADLAEETLDALGELRRVPVTSTLRRRKAVWNLADEARLRTAVLGLWATWPPEPLTHGLVVSDHASVARRQEWLDRRKLSDADSDGATTHPASLERRLERFQRSPDSVTREELSEFLPVDDDTWNEFESARHFSKGVPLSAFRSTHLNDEFYLRSALALWRQERPDLMVAYVKAIDELGHFFYEAGVPESRALGWSPEDVARFAGVVDRAYAWTDRMIAPLVDAVERDPRALLVVVSDHGWAKEADGGYNHNDGPPGILILYGAGVCGASCPPLRDPSVFDVAPTLLERLGLPLSRELEGRPLTEAFEQANPVVRVARYGKPLHSAQAIPSEIDRALTEKLEALGYID